MWLAEHLTVLNSGLTALAPCCHMVCVHVLQCPYLCLVGIVANGTIRTVALAFFLGFLRLLVIDNALCL